MAAITCHSCGHIWHFEPPMGRRDSCPNCHNDARVCLNCRFFDVSAYRQCREPQAGWVKEKDAGNFCGYFSASDLEKKGSLGAGSARDKLNELFGASAEVTPAKLATLKSEIAEFLEKKKF